MRFLDAGEHAGGVGIVEDLDLVGGDRRGRLDVEVAGQQAAQQFDDRPWAAVVALRVQRHPSGQGSRWAHVEILQRILQPEEARIGPAMAKDEVAPLLGDVLAFIDDDCVEQEGPPTGSSAARFCSRSKASGSVKSGVSPAWRTRWSQSWW